MRRGPERDAGPGEVREGADRPKGPLWVGEDERGELAGSAQSLHPTGPGHAPGPTTWDRIVTMAGPRTPTF
jgi:hypothetical protein